MRRSTRSSSGNSVHSAYEAIKECGLALNGQYRVNKVETRKFEKCLGSTGQGKLMVVEEAARASSSGPFYVLKLPLKADQTDDVRREIDLWVRLAEHLNIAALHKVGKEGELPCLLTPLACHYNLQNYINSQPVSEEENLPYRAADLQRPLDGCGGAAAHPRAH